MVSLQEQVVQEFGSPLAQKLYHSKADSGLWGCEEILIEKYFKPGSAVLEIGCGTGRVTIPLHRMKYRVTGLDIAAAMIENAKQIAEQKKLKINYLVGDARKLKYQNATFDNVIFSFNGWSQIPGKAQRYKALQEVYRVLKPGGHYIFTTTSISLRRWAFWLKHSFEFGVLRLFGRKTAEVDFGDYLFHREHAAEKSDQVQFLHFSRRSFVKKQIKKAGFRIIESSYCNDISAKNTPDWPALPCGKSPTFYVCQKPSSIS